MESIITQFNQMSKFICSYYQRNTTAISMNRFESYFEQKISYPVDK